MKQSILIRVVPENFKQWRTAHDECRQARLEYGMTDGPFYFDEKNPEIVLVHLDVESMEKASGWFKDERYKAAAQRAGKVTREILIATVKEQDNCFETSSAKYGDQPPFKKRGDTEKPNEQEN